jgi:predicted NBD/HSP70 family sugar kinase
MRKHVRSADGYPMETIGIDLGDKMSRYCIVNGDGEVVEEGSFRNQVSSIERISAASRAALHSKPALSRPGSAAN